MDSKTQRRADELTRAVTAFETWADFATAMRGGYCPTLREGEVCPENQGFNAAVRGLRFRVMAEGFPVFTGRTVVR